eukprot:gene7324-8105_t
MSGTAGLKYNFSRNSSSESPLFERQLSNGSVEQLEVHQLRLLAESLQQRVQKLERINLDLEGRLETQAKQSMALEAECISIDRQWKTRCEDLEQEIAKWKAEFQSEKVKGDRLREQLSRSERELYGILQRKYELMRGPAKSTGGVGRLSQSEAASSLKRDNEWESSNGDANHTNKTRESKKQREKRALSNLSDFLGF